MTAGVAVPPESASHPGGGASFPLRQKPSFHERHRPLRKQV